jgi:hypothetical protein
MSSLVSSSLEWLLKRALRYVVQRFLGRVLQNEVRQGRGTTGEKRKTLMMEASFDRPSLSFSFSFLYSPPSPLFMFLFSLLRIEPCRANVLCEQSKRRTH